MNRRARHMLTKLSFVITAVFSTHVSAVPMPNRADIKRLEVASNNYVLVFVQSLRWKEVASQACANNRVRIESIARPTSGYGAQLETDVWLTGENQGQPVTPDALLGMFQRTEENTMVRHAWLSREIYDAVLNECFLISAPTGAPAP